MPKKSCLIDSILNLTSPWNVWSVIIKNIFTNPILEAGKDTIFEISGRLQTRTVP